MNDKERLQLEEELLMTCSKAQAINKYIDELEESSKLSELWCKSQEENFKLQQRIDTYENPEDLTLMFMYCEEKTKDKINELQQRIDKAINKVQYIIDYGFDYDGFNQVDSLKGLIDMLVDYARQTKDILKGGENNR